MIDAAADKQLAFLHDLANGEYAEMAEQVSNQVSAARLCLLDNDKKKAYDDVLRTRLNPTSASSVSPTIDPAYVVPKSSTSNDIPEKQVKVRKSASTKRRPSRGKYVRFAMLLCLIALALVSAAIYQGRIKLDAFTSASVPTPAVVPPSPSVEESGDAVSGQQPRQSPEPTSTDAAAGTNPDRTADEPTSSRPEMSPPPATQEDEPNTAARPKRSLSDLMHGGVSSAESVPVVPVPLPNENELTEKRNLIRELYAEEYQSAKTSKERLELAKLMHKEGENSSDDPVGRFTLWRIARDIMTLEGEFESAIGIVENIDKHYLDVDADGLKVETLKASFEHVARTRRDDYLGTVEKTVDSCRASEKFDLARSLVDYLQQNAAPLLTESARSKLDRIDARLAFAEKSYEVYRRALERLELEPDDEQANESVGRYLALVRSDWETGLQHLVKGTDPLVRAAAEIELAVSASETSEASEAIAVADAWNDVAESQPESIPRTRFQVHALAWYSAAEDRVQGLDQRKVDARIAALKREIPPEDLAAEDANESKMLGFRVSTSADSRSDFADRNGNEFRIGMGSRPDGRGEAQAGIELRDVETLTVVGSASHQDMPEIDAYSKIGFFVDYHTPGGYSKRVFLGLGMRPGRQFTDAPPWGAAGPPDIITDIGRSSSYEIDLRRWAPSTWDGRCYFTIYMQNAGPNRALHAAVSW